MNPHFIKHDTFALERSYNASPARAFAAWADPALKANWFAKAEEFEFRVGGREVIRGSEPETLKLVHTKVLQSGVVELTYHPAES